MNRWTVIGCFTTMRLLNISLISKLELFIQWYVLIWLIKNQMRVYVVYIYVCIYIYACMYTHAHTHIALEVCTNHNFVIFKVASIHRLWLLVSSKRIVTWSPMDLLRKPGTSKLQKWVNGTKACNLKPEITHACTKAWSLRKEQWGYYGLWKTEAKVDPVLNSDTHIQGVVVAKLETWL